MTTPAAAFRTVRLAVGLEVVDVVRGDPADVEVGWEDVPLPLRLFPPSSLVDVDASFYDPGIGLPRWPRGQRPGRFHLAFTSESTPRPPARIRIVDRRRRYVPRRLEVPFDSLETLLAEERRGDPVGVRRHTVAVFPGAGFALEGASTAIRGRAIDGDGRPVRWVRAEATHAARGTRLGYAHGDDRGEFLLVLGNPPSRLDAPAGTRFDVRVAVHARAHGAGSAGVHLTADHADDPLSDLPVYSLGGPSGDEVVAAGDVTPVDFTRSASQTVHLVLGRVHSPPEPFILP